MLNSRFEPKIVEKLCISYWDKNKIFDFEKNGKDFFCIMMPPPNITGNLHMGHALTFTLQDILVRFQHKLGKKVLWQPGIDHAGIATEIVVERELSKKKLNKSKIGRDKFIKEIWKWKKKSGNQIINQLKILGTSVDWDKSRFTMDDELSKVVKNVFVILYNQGLIYKDKRLVNWDPKLETAISDLEVKQKNITGNLWYINYKVCNENDYITVATTRPETLFGDAAIAIHPKNKKLKKFIGKNAIIPICNRKIPIIADEYADPTKGSGAVKITPAHDFNDFEIGRKHNLPIINIFDKKARLAIEYDKSFNGLDRFEARNLVVKTIKKKGLLAKIEKNEMVVPICDRSNVIVEPYLTMQWFCNAKFLTKPINENLKKNNLKFFPKNWINSFNHWIKNIEPWCISRQIWWGHRIPAWYTTCGKVIVAETEKKALKIAKKKYQYNGQLKQDNDVLDTWFSSALWPFSTLGWPKVNKKFKNYYPTNTLITGFDIIFFWVARMVMMGLHFTKKVPFKHVYIHPLVRDEKGIKMSKSKGNVIDPKVVIEKYGADSLRFTLASLSSQGRDIKLSDKLVEDNRKFLTKIWNVARFYKLNKFFINENLKLKPTLLINKWIYAKFIELKKQVSYELTNYNFSLSSEKIYQFVWHDFCDLYVEFVKPYLINRKDYDEINTTFSWIFKNLLELLNPYIPFITEEISHRLGFTKKYSLSSKRFLTIEKISTNSVELNRFNKLVSLIKNLRNYEKNITNGSDLSIFSRKTVPQWLKDNQLIIKSIFKINDVKINNSLKEDKYLFFVSSKIKFGIQKNMKSDENNKEILNKKIKFYENEILFFKRKLQNVNFIKNAPKKIVDEQKSKLENAIKNLSLLSTKKK